MKTRHIVFTWGCGGSSIIDLEGGSQPIYNEDRSDGGMFQRRDLQLHRASQHLVQRGHTFRTRSDTEVIVHAYEEWGRECVKQFNGMFAFALHDSRTGETFFARDRCGQKPFYYYLSNGRFVFASEVKAILECAQVPRACNVPAIDAYLALRYVPEPRTMFQGIFTLPAAHFLLLKSDGSAKIERYWDVPIFQGEYPSDSVLLDEAEAMLRSAVRLTMRSDVPVGGYLSAGVDSSLLVARVTESSDKVNTYSIGFASPGDETHELTRDSGGCWNNPSRDSMCSAGF